MCAKCAILLNIMRTPPELDKFDRRILELLQEDGTLSNVELAERIHLSPSACLRRVNLLVESGLVEGISFLIRRGQDLKARRTSTLRYRGRIERRCPRSRPPRPTYRRSRNAICWPVNPIIYCASFFETCKTWSDCTPTSSLACPESNASNRH
jgi:Winged helix-turn-helix DNA-binding